MYSNTPIMKRIQSKEWVSTEQIEAIHGCSHPSVNRNMRDWINARVSFVIQDIDWGYWETAFSNGEIHSTTEIHHSFYLPGSRNLQETVYQELGEHVKEMVKAAFNGERYVVEINGKRYETHSMVKYNMKYTLT